MNSCRAGISAGTAGSLLALALVVTVGCRSPGLQSASPDQLESETKAIAFLEREVPRWSRENGCFSCHNNGDAARALFVAQKAGYRVDPGAVVDTVKWLLQPAGWSHNKGDPGFSDQRLADIQFAASLVSWSSTGMTPRSTARAALQTAALRIAAAQDADGSWQIELQNAVGTPATHGTSVATYLAWHTLQAAAVTDPGRKLEPARLKAAAWLGGVRPVNVPAASVVLLFNVVKEDEVRHTRANEALEFLRRAQTSDGGWGPYVDSPAEVYDTALALIALSKAGQRAAVGPLISRGRSYLRSSQQPDGSWAATTRPSGGRSYAQQMSTTGWATQALLATKAEGAR